jgi:hypothetical protein
MAFGQKSTSTSVNGHRSDTSLEFMKDEDVKQCSIYRIFVEDDIYVFK